MRLSLRWLKDYLQTDLGVEKLLEAMTMSGLEVEEVLDLGAVGGKVLVGEIRDLKKVEGSDHLSLCQVTTGGEPMQIICGASNIAVGQRVPLALIGATLPNGVTLKKKPVKGIESNGMMCSAKELCVLDDHEGIWILPEDTPLGETVDALVSIKVTPNRPDALCLVGIARDLAAKTGGKLRIPAVKIEEGGERAESVARVTVEDRAGCPRYAARVIDGIKIGESPLWLRRRIEAAGMRSINNVVDVTNYVLLEFGHPLHAFDMDCIAERHVVVRSARDGETMRLLDDSTVNLQPGDLLIADAEKPIALAGIMGAGNSEITAGTTSVLLEAAYFNPVTIRRTARRIGKSTEASYRFERGTDARNLTHALHRAAQLIAELAGGTVLKGHLDACSALPELAAVNLRVERVNRVLGLSLTGREIAETLVSLGFEIQRNDGTEMLAVAPSHRVDIAREADLIEEIARIRGYESVPASLPALTLKCEPPTPVERLEAAATGHLVAMGLSQSVNFSFVSVEANAAVGLADERVVKVVNPMNPEQAAMRRSLVPGLLQNLAHNLNHGVERVRLFEIGRTYEWPAEPPGKETERSMAPPATERLVLCALLCGGERDNWRTPAANPDFYDIKGLAEGLLDRLGVSRLLVEPATDVGHLHPGRAASLSAKGQRLCWFGELHPALARELDIKKSIYLLEMPLDEALAAATATRGKYSELPRFPAMQRDIAIVVDTTHRSLELERSIRSAARDLVTGVELFDQYVGDKVPAGKRSLAYSITFRNPERTLQDEEVNAAMEKILGALEKKHGAALRG